MPRSTSARAIVQTPFDAAAARARQSVALRDLDVAPENLRAGEPADDDIPLLADALFAAGQLQPITVRPGRRRERPWMALDGRRRLLALRRLLEQGRIDGDFAVDVLVETDPARQAAAAVLTNTAVPVHVADVIAAIGRMMKAKLGLAVIARALGQAEIDIRRLAALSALPDVALEALRAGRLNLRQARLLARLPDPAEQAELARAALEGRGFADWRVSEALDAGRVTARDPRCALVPPDRYVEAGGRIEADLFDERPPVLLDPALLTDLWVARLNTVAAILEAEGLTVHLSAAGPATLPDDLEEAGYVYGGAMPAGEMARYRDARAAEEAAARAVEARLEEGGGDGTGQGPGDDDLDQAIVALVRAALVRGQIALGGRAATTVVLCPEARQGLRVEVWAPVEPEAGPEAADGPEDVVPEPEGPAPFVAPRATAPAAETDGFSHGQHALRTEVATRGLIRALADDPPTALTALIARLFGLVAVRGHTPRSESALAVSAEVFNPKGGRVIAALDGVVRERLDDRRAAWEASGLTLVGWIHGLDDGEKLALLAELTALTLDLTEARTSLIRRSARAEACELARLSRADITAHWTPDAPFLGAHSKTQLAAMLETMGQADVRAAALDKPGLVATVEAAAARRRWAPAALSWSGHPEASAVDVGPAPPGEADAGPTEGEDGAGAFEVTADGEAALAELPPA